MFVPIDRDLRASPLAEAPLPMATIVMNAPTPMMMPSGREQRAQAVAREAAHRHGRGARRSSRGPRAARGARGPSGLDVAVAGKTMTRLAYVATSGSCVTRTIVMPRSALRRVRMPHDLLARRRVEVSPVGSSASSSGGSPTRARARWRHAAADRPRALVGEVVGAVGEPDDAEGGVGAPRHALAPRHARVRERQLDRCRARSCGRSG